MTDDKEQQISLKIIDDPHTAASEVLSKKNNNECDEDVILTRYLYNKTEVEISFTKSVFDQQTDAALFWGYELYFSGFMNETFDIIFVIYTTYYRENHPLFEGYICRMKKKWQESPESHEIIGELITNFVYCKMSIRNEIEKRQNITNRNSYSKNYDDKPIISQKYITVNPSKFEMYKTTDQSLIDKAWKSMSILCKYEPVRDIADILGKKIHTKQHPLKYGWEYYAYNSPIWKKRINEYSGFINKYKKTVEFIDENKEEEFYDIYGYDLDEQPRHIQNMTMWLDDTNPPQMSWETFCDTYKKNMPLYTLKIKIKKNVNLL